LNPEELVVSPATPPHAAAARETIECAQRHLLSLQSPEGWWKGPLDTNVTMDAEDLLMREFLGIRDETIVEQASAWIRSQQRSDGSWATFTAGPPEPSTTLEAYVALRLAGDAPDAEHMQRAAQVVRDLGGLENCRVFTRMWMALFGLWSWDDLPALPPEVIFLPPWFPLNIYDFGCWARQTIVPLTMVAAHRPVRPLGFSIDELLTRPDPVADEPWSNWAGRFQRLDRLLHRYERRPLGPLRRLALTKSAEWVIRRQEADGGWGGIQPPWVYSIIALNLYGYPLDHPVIAKGLAGLDDFAIVENGMRRLEACQSPVWDTALSMVALADAGIEPDHEQLVRAADWILDEEIRTPGDWAVRRPNLEPGGWAFEFANDHYPDIDDTAEVILALRKVEHPQPQRVEDAISRGTEWVLGMQSRSGGWAAFDADNTRALCGELPFCDFGEVIDPPSADVSAHVLEMLALEGRSADPITARGRAWLLDEQEPSGSWFGRWGANHIYGTGAAIPALIELGQGADSLPVRRAVRWLEEHQNSDGGWGEDLRSYRDPSWIGRGESTPSQTGWALLALLAADERSEAVEQGVRWLVANQRDDGGWDEVRFTGTGFPGDFYINYQLYRIVFPLMALGRYASAAA
jgi:squalene-hopene/tetraprenyl-beta-curcumene cyclase